MQQLNSATELLDVQLPDTLIESPSVSTFLPEEDASICPLLLSTNNTNGSTTPLAFSHPLTPCSRDAGTDDGIGIGGCGDADENKLETGSSSGSSTGHGLEMVADSAAASLFNKHAAYHHLHLQTNNNLPVQEGGHHHHHHHHMVMTNGHNGHTLSGKEAPPSFVSWNWPLIRKCTFFIFMSSLFAMCALVVAMIVTLPKSCNPKTAWYRGRVFYEIFPASFQDSNNDGVGDLRGISNRIDYLVAMGVSAVRLNSIYPSPHYPEDYESVTSLTEVADVLGERKDVRWLAESLHTRNISLILDLSVQSFWNELLIEAPAIEAPPPTIPPLPTTTQSALSNETTMEEPPPNVAAVLLPPSTPMRENLISTAIRQWISLGVDGFYIKGLEHVPHGANIQLARHLAEWQRMLGPFGVLILGEAAYKALTPEERQSARPHIDLIDIPLEMLDGTKAIEERLNSVLGGELKPLDEGVWLHWSIGGIDRERLTARHSPKFTLAATLLQLMLPGTPSIFYGDEIALNGRIVDESHGMPLIEDATHQNDTQHLQHLTTMQWPAHEEKNMQRTHPWLPQLTSFSYENHATIANMVALRERSPAIYKNSICKSELTQSNTEIRRSHDDILIVERFYPRRNSFVSVTNFGNKSVRMDMSSMFYSGYAMLQKPDGERGEKIYFSHFEINAMETIIVKLDK